MRQAVMTEPGKIEIKELEKPIVGDNDILLRIRRIGVCGSDIHVYHGKHPFTPYPVVQGHEYCGIVEAVGCNITDIETGSLATARPQLVCGQCGPCKRGDYNVCEQLRVQGFQAAGCAQDYFVVPRNRIVILPSEITLEQGALVEPVSVGCHSTARATDIEGKNIVVVGAGTIGNLIAQVAVARGAGKVLIVDVSQYRLDVAAQCGIQFCSNAREETLEDAAKRVFGEEGFQIAFDAAGVQDGLTAIIKNIEKGGQLIIVGVYEDPPKIDMAVVCEHEIRIAGSMMYKHEDYVEAAEMIAKKQIITDPLVTKKFPFEQYLDAYRFIDEQGEKTLKVMIEL